MPEWLKNATVYEIYPQSFLDTNGDGIGDLPGVIEKLDYIRSLNADTIWLNPCFVSPFQDAGYDVADYYRVAPRYGTNDDLKRLFDEAHKRGMHVLLDLVAGHTSIEHPWFADSQRGKESPYCNYYIWTDGWRAPTGGYRFISGYGPRDGYFMINFFYCQPALNYGFVPPDPELPWQLPADHPDVLKVREELRRIMKFWLDLGCDGFRVGMAASLVRGENRAEGIRALWQDYRAWLDREYPEAALVSEWCFPSKAIDAGFHVDFMAHSHESGYTKLFRAEPERIGNSPFAGGHSFFDRSGLGDAVPFLQQIQAHLKHLAGRGYPGIITGNHDLGRLRGGRTLEEVKVAMAFLLMLPGVPFIYAGDEIGMDNVYGLGNKEGSYNRSAARTPMQWTDAPDAGFTSAPAEDFYLPLDPSPARPDVASQENDPDSVLNLVRRLLAFRKECSAAGNGGGLRVVYAEPETCPVIYLRQAGSESILVAVNPSEKPVRAAFGPADVGKYISVFATDGVKLSEGHGESFMEMPPVSYAVYRKRGRFAGKKDRRTRGKNGKKFAYGLIFPKDGVL